MRFGSALTALVTAAALTAATLTWTGAGGDGNINNPANWSPAQSPTLNDVLIFGGLSNLAPQLDTAASADSITFDNTAGTFTLGGSGTYTIRSGGITNNDNQVQRINNSITLGADQTWNAAAGALIFGGSIDTAGFRLAASGNFNMTINGAISGSGGLTKNGTGTLTMTGSGPNTYTGSTIVNQGTLILAKSGGSALNGPLVNGNGGGSAVVSLNGSNQLNGAALTINAGGQLNLGGYNDSASSLTLAGGTIAPFGQLTLGTGGLTSLGSSITGTINATLALSGATAFNIADGEALDERQHRGRDHRRLCGQQDGHWHARALWSEPSLQSHH